MKRLSFFFVLFLLFAISPIRRIGAQDNPVLTITRVEGYTGVIKIYYRVTDPKGDSFVTAGWQFSADGGRTWENISASAIGDNAPKPPGESFITWDTTKTEAFKAAYHPRMLFRMYVWNPNDKGSWRTVKEMPTERQTLSAVALNGKIYAIGGFNGNFLNTVEEYTPETNEWHAVKPMPTAREWLAAVALNGKIYAIGGYNGNFLNTVEEYTPETDEWHAVKTMPTARRALSAVALNGKIYAIGGVFDNEYLNIVEEYTPETDEWHAVKTIPTARAALAAGALNGKIYAIGGAFVVDIQGAVEEYTPETNSWRMVAPITSPRWGLAAATLNGRLYAAGGGDTDEYTPETNSWRIVAPITPLRWGIAAAALNGRLYAMGGWDGAGGKSYNIVEEYTPPRASETATYPSWLAVVTVTSNNPAVKRQQLTFGVKPNATEGFDSGLDEPASPAPPEPIQLDAYFPLSHQFITRLTTDLRPDADSMIWQLKVRADQEGFTLRWDVSQIPSLFTVTLEREASASINMRTQSSLALPQGNYTLKIIIDVETNVLTVEGTIYQEDGKTIAPNGLTVTVKNLTRPTIPPQKDITGAVAGNGRYIVNFLDFQGGIVACAGDELLVTIEDKGQEVARTKHALSGSELAANRAVIDVVLTQMFQFKLDLVAGINLISAPLKPSAPWRLSDLLRSIGPEADFVIGYDVKTGKFVTYMLSFPESSPTNLEVKGTEGYILLMKANKTVQFTGKAWEGNVSLTAGINLMAVPLEPQTKMRLSDLLKFIGPEANFVIRYDVTTGKFVSYLPSFPESSPTNVEIKGGEGYILIMEAAKSLLFEGTAWKNVTSPAAPFATLLASQNSRTSTPLLVIDGAVTSNTGNPLNSIRVQIRNLAKNLTTTEVTGTQVGSGQYAAVFADFSGKQVAKVGDILEITVLEQMGTFGERKLLYPLTPKDIQTASIHLGTIALSQIPNQSAMLANYPNPFNPETWIPYQLSKASTVTFTIYEAQGRVVKRLNVGLRQAGTYRTPTSAAHWDGRNEAGEAVASGVYFVEFSTEGLKQVRRMVLLK